MMVWSKTEMAPVGRCELHVYLQSALLWRLTSAFAPDGHLGRVSTEGGDVVCDPLQTQTLVAKSKVGRAFCRQLLPSQETEGIDSIDIVSTDGFIANYLQAYR